MNHETNAIHTAQDATARRTAILADFRATFGTDSGKRVLTILRASTNHGKPSFLPAANGQSYDPIAAAIRDGRKSVVSEILDYLEHPEAEPAKAPKAVTG